MKSRKSIINSMIALTVIAPMVLNTVSVIGAEETSDVKRPRVCITNDGEIDDKNSFVHLLYYANEIDLVGLVQTSSFAHWAGSSTGPDESWMTSKLAAFNGVSGSGKEPFAWPGTEWMFEFIDDYAEIYPNLVTHDANYPTPEYLKSIVKIGNIGYTGDMDEATEGSDYIKQLILDEIEAGTEEPLYITAWGGFNTVGRALLDIYTEYGETEEWADMLQKIYDEIQIYLWYGQDKQADDSDPVLTNVIAPYYPELTMIDVNQCQAMGWGWATALTNDKHQIPEVMSGAWLQEHIDANHGALLDWYVTDGDGTEVEGEFPQFQYGTNDALWSEKRDRYDFCGEGDTPTFLPFLDMGLGALENCEYGTLAGRFEKTGMDVNGITLTNFYTMAKDTIKMSDWANVGGETTAEEYDSSARWIADIMNSFATRADWGVTAAYEDANHNPSVTVQEGNAITAKAGDVVTLTAEGTDPDGDAVSYKWFNYKEAGTYASEITIENPSEAGISINVPEDAVSGDTIHVLVRVSDNGEHSLSYYQRVIITVE